MDGETVLPEGWVETKLDDIAEWSSGGTPKSTEPKFYGGDIPWLIIADLNNSIVTKSTKKINQLGLENSSAKWVEIGSVMIAIYGSIGKLGIAGIRCTTNQAIAFTTKIWGEISNKYIFYYLKYNEPELLNIGQGGAQKNISQRILKEFPFKLPPLNEQKRIVAKLDSIMPRIDSVKERLEKIPVILKRFRQSVLTAAVTGKLTEKWREEHPDVESAEVLLERIREERLKRYEKECEEAKKKGERKPNKLPSNINYRDFDIDLPEKWIGTSPEHLASPDKYALAIGPFGSNLKVSDYVENGVPIVFVKNIKSENFLKDRKYVSKEKAAELSQHIVKSGDLLITKMGTPPGDCCIYHDLEDAIITSDCLKFSTWNEFVESKFYKVVINSNIVRRQLIEITQGVAQQKISLERFKSITLPLPPLEEQKEIVRQVDKLFALADKVEDHYKKAKLRVDKLSQSVLAKAFRGELVPQDPNDEPAEKLLERIHVASGITFHGLQ
jgi:type I restriction enzyme S subunit